MKSSEILTRAAELVDSGEVPFACWAIRGEYTRELFSSMYKPKDPSCHAWFGSIWTEAHTKHRVIALLLCAAIAESNGD